MFNDSTFLKLQEKYLNGTDTKIVMTVPNYIINDEQRILINESTLYNDCWSLAVDINASIVLIYGWNLYDTGSVIEPTVEFGNYTLNVTKELIRTFKNQEKEKRERPWLPIVRPHVSFSRYVCMGEESVRGLSNNKRE